MKNQTCINQLLTVLLLLCVLFVCMAGTAFAAENVGIAIDLSTLTETYLISDSGEYTFTGSGSYGIKVESGNPTIVLNNASITVGEGSAIDIASGSNATIFVLGDNTISTSKTEYSDAPCGGIFVAEGGTVNITSNGTDNILRAHGTLAAAIGGKYDYDNNESHNAGNINISNVTVYAYTNNFYAAAIGAAGEGTCGTINITNAVVYAYGAGDRWTSAPGIGNAWSLLDWSDTIPIVIISDSEVHTFRYNPYSDYIGYLGDESGDTYATGSINCGDGGSVKNSTIYCYTGLDATTTDKVVKYGALGGLLKEDGTCEGEHSGGTATCTTLAVCENCGASYGEVGGHSPDAAGYTVNADGTHSYTCFSCGNPFTESHTFTDGACTGCGVTGGYCGAETNEGGAESVWWTLTDSNSVLTIGGTGAMADFNDSPWYTYRNSITSLTVQEGVTTIGRYAFHQTAGLKSVTIPASVTKLGYCAFVGSGLETVTFADESQLTTIDYYAFQNCDALTEITLPAGVGSFWIDVVFYGCTALTDIHVAEGNTTYKSVDGVLYTADGTTLMFYPEGKTATSFTTPTGVTAIGQLAFSDNGNIESVTLSEDVTTISDQAFLLCGALAEVTIPASVTSIGYDAFFGCDALTTVNVPCSWDGSLYTFGEGVTVNKNVHIVEATYTSAADGTQHVATYDCCGVTVTEPHTYDDEDSTCVCGAVKTYTITLYADGAKIVEINGKAVEISNGETFTAPHGQELTVKFENTVSQKETGVQVGAGNDDDSDLIPPHEDTNNILTIPASVVNQDFYIGANAYLRVQFNLHGGTLTEDGTDNFDSDHCTWDNTTSTLRAYYRRVLFLEPEYFQLTGHTFAGAQVVGSDVVEKEALTITSEMPVDILWNCTDTTTTLTPVEAKAATCIAEGNIAHYICTCGKLYAEDKTTVLTSVTLPVDPDNHVGMDSTTGKCACGEDMAVAVVTTGSTTTYYETLQEAMTAANEKTATVKLLTDGEITARTEFHSPSNVTLNLNGKNVTASAHVSVYEDAALTITGSGNWEYNKTLIFVHAGGKLTIENGNFIVTASAGQIVNNNSGELIINGGTFTNKSVEGTPIVLNDSGTATISGEPVFIGADDYTDEDGETYFGREFSLHVNSKLDLSKVTGNMNGWRVQNGYVQDGVTVGQNLILPASGYALKVGDHFVTTLATDEIGTIVAHAHNYTTEDYDATHHWTACACGAATEKVNHTFTYTPVTGKEVHIVGCSGCTYTAPEEIPHEFTNGVCVCTAKAVAKVDDTFYVSIHNALRAAEEIDGCTLTLLEDITLTSMSSTAAYTNKGTFILDLNGKALSSNKGTLSVLGSADLTIKDSAGGGKIISTGSNAIYQTGGTVTIESGTFEGTLDGVFLSGDSTLSVEGGSFVGSRAMITGFGSDCVIDLTAIDPAGFTLKNNGSGTFAPRLPSGYAMVNGSGTVVESLSAEESATVKASLENATVTLSENIFVYDGQPHMPTVTVTLNGRNLTEGTDYQVLYMRARKMTNGEPTQWFGDHTTSDTCVKADKDYYAVIIGMGNYYTADEFTLYKNFVIEPRLLSIKADDQTIPVGGSVDSANFTITEGALVEGHTLTAEVQVADGTLATPGTYTDVLYLDTDSVSIMAGEENVKSNYSITPDTGTLTIVEHIHEWTYTASDDIITATCSGTCPYGTITFKLVIPTGVDFNSGTDEKTATWTVEPASADGLLSCGTTYSAVSDNAKLADGKPCNAGEYEVTLNVENAATVTATLTIAPVQIGQPDALTDGVYTGEAHQPAVTIPNCTEGKDFTVTYPEDMVNAGDKTITVTGKGNYTGTAEVDYHIARAPIGAAVIAAEDQVYTGEALEPAFTVTLNGKTLKHNVDFTYNWTNNVNVGEGKIVINGIGNYEGQAEGTFVITSAPADLTAETYLGETMTGDFTYGDVITIKGAVTVDQQNTFSLRRAPAANEVALYLEGGNEVIAGPVAADPATGEFTLTYDTSNKDIGIGQRNLTLAYVSDGNKQDTTGSLTVTLLPKELTIISAGAADRAYEKGNKLVDVTGVDLDGIVAIGDDVKVDLTGVQGTGVQGTLPSDNAGTYTTMALPQLTLTGNESAYYTIAADDAVTTSVEITPKEITNPTIVLDASSFVYDGTEKKPAVTSVKDGDDLIDATEYTVSYANNIEMGTATVTLTDAAGGNYTVSGSTSFQITKSGTEMTATADKNSYTYGETITVTGTVKATGTAPATTLTLRSAPAAQQVALFAADGTQLTDPVNVVEGAYTLTYNTADKGILPAASITLKVKFVGDDNMADQSASVTVALTAKSIGLVLSGSASKVYDGTDTVTDAGNLTINLNGIIADDTVSATAAGYAYADETVGQSKAVTANGITLSGADSIFYTLAQTEASAQIGEIKKAMLIGLTEPADTTLDVYCADADAVIGKLPDTVVYHLADGKTVDLKVEWSCTAYDSTPGAINAFAWAVSDSEKLACYEIAQNVADDGTVIVTNSAFLPVTVTGTDTAITYNGTTYDVTQMFAIDSNAGAADFEIIGGGTGEGTLNGSVLTITKAGTITIKVTTAPNAAYAAGEATAVLTINKGTPAVTVPTGLTAWYGQKLSDIALPTVDGGAWSWTDTNSTVGDAGVQTHQAIFTPADTNLWNITTHPVNITVVQAGTSFGEMKVYNGDTESTTFTYGETITVKAEATAVQPATFSLRSLIAPAKHQMALFIRNADGSEVQISEAVNEQNGVYTMTYNTTGKALSIGDNALIAKFVGDENMADYQETVLVTLNPKELTIASLTAQDRVYEPGNQQVTITGTEVSGKADANDDVSVLIDGMTATISSENVGTYDTALIPQDVSLTGNHAGYYFARGNVAVSIPQGVEITQATPYTTSGVPAQPVFDPIYQDGMTLGDIPVSLPVGTFNVPGTIEWEAPGDTPVTEGTPFTWVFTPDDPNWKPVTGTVVIYPDGEPPVITAPAGDQEVTVYEGEQGTMFITAADATSYQWYINRYDGLGYVPISGATSASYTTSVVNLGNDGFTYYCVASNAYGNAESPVFLLQVLEKIEVPETGDESNIALWAALAILSIAGLTIITMNGRRSKITR